MLKIFISLEDRTKVRKGDRRVSTSLCQNQVGEDKSCLKTLVAGADCRGRRPFLDRRRGSSLLGHVLDGLMLLHGLSQSLPLNSSTTTLRTVPSSRQWGAIPAGRWA